MVRNSYYGLRDFFPADAAARILMVTGLSLDVLKLRSKPVPLCDMLGDSANYARSQGFFF